MNIYPSTKVKPYVYMGIHKATGEIYIGYREINIYPSHIDLFEYRTSSSIVNPKFDEYNWYIVAEFDVGDDAYDLEQQLIHENWNNPLLVNRACFFEKNRFKKPKGCQHRKPGWNKGTPQSAESNAKRSAALIGKSTKNKGRIMSDEEKLKRSLAMKGKKNAGSFGNRPAWNKGKSMSEEQKAKISATLKGKNNGQ